MFETPTPATADRMLAAQQHAADQFGLRATGRRVWGYRGRTLSSAAGPHWLRVVCAEAGIEGGTLWNGPSTSRTLPAAVPRPDLCRIRDWTTDGYAYRAELYALAPDPRDPTALPARIGPGDAVVRVDQAGYAAGEAKAAVVMGAEDVRTACRFRGPRRSGLRCSDESGRPPHGELEPALRFRAHCGLLVLHEPDLRPRLAEARTERDRQAESQARAQLRRQ